MKYISKTLLREIRDKQRYLGELDAADITLKAKKVEQKALERMAQIHSFQMENPNLRVPFCVPKNREKRIISEGIKRLEEAFKWGCRTFNPKKFDEAFIREIAGRITPELYGGEIATYREMGTSINGAATTPPYPSKVTEVEIPWFEESLRGKLQSEEVGNLLQAAIFAHFQLTRIHPFRDGNGRTSRILQDVILNYADLPPPIIEVAERSTYYQLLDRAVYDWKHNRSLEENNNGATEGEGLFYTFMAGKVNSSLDKLICGTKSRD